MKGVVNDAWAGVFFREDSQSSSLDNIRSRAELATLNSRRSLAQPCARDTVCGAPAVKNTSAEPHSRVSQQPRMKCLDEVDLILK